MVKNNKKRLFFLELAKKFLPYLILQSIIITFWSLDLSFRPYLIKLIINELNFITVGVNHISNVLTYIYIYMGSMAFITFMSRLYDFVEMRYTPHIRAHILKFLFNKTVNYQDWKKIGNEAITNRINDIVNGIPAIMKIAIDKFFGNSLALLIAICTVWSVNIKFACATTIWVALYIAVSFRFSKNLKNLAENVAETRSGLYGKIGDILTNISLVQLYNQQRNEENLVSKILNKLIIRENIRDWFVIKINLFQSLSFVILQSVCLWWLFNGLLDKSFTIGDCTLILSINTTIINYMWNTAKDIHDFLDNLGNINQSLEIIIDENSTDESNLDDIKISNGEIKFENVCFKHKNTNFEFKNLSLTIKSKEKVALVGFSGSGKSTFINLILGVFQPSKGNIIIDRQNVSSKNKHSLREAIAVIPQNTCILNRSINENIKYAKPKASEQEVIEAAKKANAHGFITSIPDSYNFTLGHEDSNLSSGQRQRIAIARAFLKNSSIMILDEATSNLDCATENNIQQSLDELTKNKTTIIIAHHLRKLLQMDRILVFDNGKIVEEGTHQELLKLGRTYKKLWEAQTNNTILNDE